jgi:hypothetical protein
MAAVVAAASGVGTLRAQDTAEVAAVERAALDYLEGFYEGDPGKIRRSVHPDVVKYGFYIPRGESAYTGEAMTFQEMLEYAASVRERGNHPPETAPKEVEVLEVMDQIAAARVTAWWGSDYLHLARVEGRWTIMHVLWQTPPPS